MEQTKTYHAKKKKRKKGIKCNNIMKQYEIYSTIYYDRKHLYKLVANS